MDANTKNSPCEECDDVADGLQLHAEVEHLREHLAERDGHIIALEAEFLQSSARVHNLEEQVDTWREKYERLYDSHKRVQKLNQVLEDKLLQMVDRMKSEKSQLTKDIATLSVRLAESKHNYSMLQKENERYKNDMNLAIQLLQCKPDNFVSQKLDNLPVDTQARVSQYVMSKSSKPGGSVPSKNGNDHDTFDASEYEFNISASLMTKILEDSIQDSVTKHCDTCTCMRSQNKPFCYNETYYSVSTQTLLSGGMKNSLCLNCNAEIKSGYSCLSIRSASPHAIKLINEKNPIHYAAGPLYIIPQPSLVDSTEPYAPNMKTPVEMTKINGGVNDTSLIQSEEIRGKMELIVQKETVTKIGEDVQQLRRNLSVNMEPAVHHKLCDRTKTSISSKRSSHNSVGNGDDLLIKDVPNIKETKPRNENQSFDNLSLRKNSQSSMGALSRDSSVAKSTVSTHKSNTQVGPGPRFCHLRMQAGSKNILLDNVEPDVPPVLYRRQSKCNENTILFKELKEGLDNFIDLNKVCDNVKENVIVHNDNMVVESTLVDVHIDNGNKESTAIVKTTAINPMLLNVSSSPLQPFKTHTFSNSSEHNNNKSRSTEQNATETDNLLDEFNRVAASNSQNNNQTAEDSKNSDGFTPTDNDVKIFNFDRYEQNKLANQYTRPMRKIDMSQLHCFENTRISKDLPPLSGLSKLPKKVNTAVKSSLPAIVNVYPNLTQTHLKVNENKVFTNDQSTSSLSSDDSAAVLQKQQLLRVAEWVEKNLEQQNNFNDPLEDDVTFSNKAMIRDSKLSRLTETLNELALNMPHPVSKYSKTRDAHNNWVHNNAAVSSANKDKARKQISNTLVVNHVAKETIFPVECGEVPVTEINKDNAKNRPGVNESELDKQLCDALKSNGDKDISPEDLARMEYNVKKFLLSGPHWVNPESVGRSRRTSSKTETDV